MESACSQSYVLGTERLVCRCLQVRESALLDAIETYDLRTLKEVRRCTGAGDGCTACHRRLQHYLDERA